MLTGLSWANHLYNLLKKERVHKQEVLKEGDVLRLNVQDITPGPDTLPAQILTTIKLGKGEHTGNALGIVHISQIPPDYPKRLGLEVSDTQFFLVDPEKWPWAKDKRGPVVPIERNRGEIVGRRRHREQLEKSFNNSVSSTHLFVKESRDQNELVFINLSDQETTIGWSQKPEPSVSSS